MRFAPFAEGCVLHVPLSFSTTTRSGGCFQDLANEDVRREKSTWESSGRTRPPPLKPFSPRADRLTHLHQSISVDPTGSEVRWLDRRSPLTQQVKPRAPEINHAGERVARLFPARFLLAERFGSRSKISVPSATRTYPLAGVAVVGGRPTSRTEARTGLVRRGGNVTEFEE